MQLVEMGLHTLSEAQIQWLAPSQRARNPEMRAEGGGWRDGHQVPRRAGGGAGKTILEPSLQMSGLQTVEDTPVSAPPRCGDLSCGWVAHTRMKDQVGAGWGQTP